MKSTGSSTRAAIASMDIEWLLLLTGGWAGGKGKHGRGEGVALFPCSGGAAVPDVALSTMLLGWGAGCWRLER
jgi:hypothetical protein